MLWLVLVVAAAVLGLAVLALIAFRLYRQVRGLGREVAAAGERLTAQLAELEEIAARRSGVSWVDR